MFEQPYIFALTDWEMADRCLESNVQTVFLLTGTMLDLPEKVYALQQRGKTVYLHVDLITGVQANTHEGMRYIAEVIAPDGIISTKGQAIMQGKKLGLKTIQRIFLIDRHALNKAIDTCLKIEPDAVEAMPGLIMPRIIEELVARLPFHIVSGGLFQEKEEMDLALRAGAAAVSGSHVLDCFIEREETTNESCRVIESMQKL
ncbi:glycerol-3-phosphate responsive antiterminator [Halalkalibacterium halodurans]|uniref:glycerol-3-phosphate responsive antiterminator n=1 Tax=Halalkalibacterium halodurans TaxID=86665 RepID=UPI002AA9CAD7|nr:glycerol-3-phosphate responsive antiterminator [Halalkalibacterium halodurans]MDY7221608.1 glycerol-3-phosphate responsive antiterminator [Halalkalibacterium halodurans]MDY7240884.1 glycerol-3-phosphate responsive antiterminator [Halalkalibacterium halodurans]